MYRIEKVDFGLKLSFSGNISEGEMTRWLKDSEKALSVLKSGFKVFVDMRFMEILSHDSLEHLIKGQKQYREKGMDRSAVVLTNSDLKIQLLGAAIQTGVYIWERYIDATLVKDWENAGKNWLLQGIEPD